MRIGLHYFWDEVVRGDKVERFKVYFEDLDDAEQAMHESGLLGEIKFETVELKTLINELNGHRTQEALDRLNK